MPQIVCNIALDVSVNDAGQQLMAKQGDSGCRLLCVQFTDCKRPLPIESGAVVLLNVAKGEETAAFEGSVTSEGKALFVLPDFVLAEVGTVTCDVSALTLGGGRLTSSKFEIVVEEAVCPSADLGSATGTSDLALEFLASQMLVALTPEAGTSGYVLRPAVNRKYTVDLSDDSYATDGVWKNFALELPTPADPARENWIVLYCHAPVKVPGGGVPMAFDADVLFSDGAVPFITMSDFEILCTYSPMTSTWRVGVVQYEKDGGTV